MMKRKPMRDYVDTVLALPVILMYRVIRRMPSGWAVSICRLFAWTAYILRVRRSVIETNIAIAFPDLSPGDRVDLIRRIYLNLGEFLGSWLTLPSKKGRLVETVPLVNASVLEELKPAGKGLLVCSGHLGHWEILAARFAEHGKWKVTIVRHRLNNTRLDQWFTDVHELMDFGDVIKGKSLLEIFRRLRRDEIIGMLVDQSGRGAGIWIPFFNRPTSFHRGPGMILSKSGCPAITAFCVPSATGGWEIRLRKMQFEITGDLETDTYQVMREYARHLEAIIREFPDRYFWFHRRWKTRIPEDIQEAWRSGRMQ